MQIGDELDANFIASTILEIESLVPLLKNLKARGRVVNVLYGIPLVPSQVARLARVAVELGENSISVMIDHPDQLVYLEQFFSIANFPTCVFLKVDTGYHRAGLPPAALNKNGLIEKMVTAEKCGYARLLGVYSHSSLSYGGSTPSEAMEYLRQEISGCKDALKYHANILQSTNRELVISVGATPQAIFTQNLFSDTPLNPEWEALKASLGETSGQEDVDAKIRVELHAGVYSLLDMQQLSTNARVHVGQPEEEIAIAVLAEVCSVYNDGERNKPEVLLAAGTLALGREPCPSYRGWGFVSSWGQSASERLIVERISQEHAIVSWDAQTNNPIPLAIGQVVKIFPNHACVAGAFYSWYFVVDSDQDSKASRIVDVWVRARGCGLTDAMLDPRGQ